MMRIITGLLLCVLGAGCGDPVPDPIDDAGSVQRDAEPIDAGSVDSGSVDSGTNDAGSDAGVDDAGAGDAGVNDAGVDDDDIQSRIDAGSVDAGGEPDDPPVDAGTPAPDSCINIEGAMFPGAAAGGGTALARFDSVTLNSAEKLFDNEKAANTTGVVLRFTADVPVVGTNSIQARFRFELEPRGPSIFSLYRNGNFIKDVSVAAFTPPKSTAFSIPAVAGRATYEIVMPHWSAPIFMGLTIDGTCVPQPPSTKKKYIAIGDSITHGTGQPKTIQTYPYLLADHFNWELFNLGVGGAQISPALGSMIRKKPVDFITILIGFNDWNGSKTLASFVTSYRKLITDIRFVDAQGNGHPQTPIICITPTFATKPTSNGPSKGSVTLEQYRAAIRTIVNDRKPTDPNIYLLEGTSLINSATYLSDFVHLNVPGAVEMKDRLVQTIPPAALP